MKKIKLFALAIIAVAITMVACEKTSSTELDNQTNVTKTVAALNVANTENPYDYAGKQHNEGLDNFFIKEAKHRNNDWTYDDAFDFFNIDAESRSYILKYKDYALSSKNEMLNEASLQNNGNTNIIDFYISIRNVIVNPNLTLAAKIENIKELELEINSNNFSENEMIVLYQAASIARYSSYYWTPACKGGLDRLQTLKTLGISIGDEIEPCTDDAAPAIIAADVWGAAFAAFTTLNPFVALGYGLLSSAVTAIDKFSDQ